MLVGESIVESKDLQPSVEYSLIYDFIIIPTEVNFLEGMTYLWIRKLVNSQGKDVYILDILNKVMKGRREIIELGLSEGEVVLSIKIFPFTQKDSQLSYQTYMEFNLFAVTNRRILTIQLDLRKIYKL